MCVRFQIIASGFRRVTRSRAQAGDERNNQEELGMSTLTLAIIIGVILIGIVGIAAAMFLKKHKTERLQTRFGPEYARAVEESGGRRKAEAGLEKREKRVEGFAIRPLAASDRERYLASWRKVQAEFVDDPNKSVTQADQLLGDVMSTRGYSVANSSSARRISPWTIPWSWKITGPRMK
jgi:hypothetical protein